MAEGKRAGARTSQNSTNQTTPKLTIENREVGLDELRPHPRNYNRHPASQVERIGASLRKFGQPRSIVVWRSTIIAGHGVVEAAKALGWQEIRADVLPEDYPEHLALAYVAADNELGRLGDPDQAALAAILEESRAQDGELLEAMGYSDKEFAKLLNEVAEGETAPTGEKGDEAAALLEKWRVEPGQVWQCGKHRLMCGDSTSRRDVDLLMGGRKAALLLTDPPYNVGVDFGEETDDNKTGSDYEQFTRSYFDLWSEYTDRQVVTPAFANLALWVSLYSKRIRMIAPWIKRNGVTRGYISQFACWEPIVFFGDANPDWEPVLFLQNDRKQKGWNRIRNTDVFDYPISSQPYTGGHPTPKPLGMWADMINSYTDIDDLVVDSFGGSGTTLIAAERMIRRSALMEISTKYCSVILERYQIETGQTPTLVEA